MGGRFRVLLRPAGPCRPAAHREAASGDRPPVGHGLHQGPEAAAMSLHQNSLAAYLSLDLGEREAAVLKTFCESPAPLTEKQRAVIARLWDMVFIKGRRPQR